MAKIIESEQGARKIIRLSTDDIISVVQTYQRIVTRKTYHDDIRSCLNDTVMYLPEDIY